MAILLQSTKMFKLVTEANFSDDAFNPKNLPGATVKCIPYLLTQKYIVSKTFLHTALNILLKLKILCILCVLIHVSERHENELVLVLVYMPLV